MAPTQQKPTRFAGGFCDQYWLRELLASFLLQSSADVDEVVGDHAKPGPALHADLASVAATVEPVSPLDHTDASLASGPPFLAVAEPPLLLLASALNTLG